MSPNRTSMRKGGSLGLFRVKGDLNDLNIFEIGFQLADIIKPCEVAWAQHQV